MTSAVAPSNAHAQLYTRVGWTTLALTCAAITAAIVASYPIGPALLGAALAVYAIALWRWLWLWLLVIPAVIAAVDFTFWTGLIVVSEADAVVLVTLAVLIFRAPPRLPDLEMSRWTGIVLALSIVSYAISIVFGLLPIHGVSGHSANPYLDSTNALRLAKGFLLSLLLLPFLAREIRGRAGGFVLFALGMLGGLALVGAAGALEWLLFVGNLDRASDYRIVGPFSSMHIGGGQIGTYLAMALPFLAIAFLRPRGFLVWTAVAILALLSGLVLIATFARAGYLAAVAGLVVLALLWLAGASRRSPSAGRISVGLIVTVIAGLIVLVGISQTGFMARRFAHAMDEYATRTTNWRNGLSVRDDGLRTLIFGMGLGTYPRVFAARNRGDEKGTGLELAEDNGRTSLTIIDRSRFYFAQRVPALPDRSYRADVSVRTERRGQNLGVTLCENVLLFSRACDSTQLEPPLPGKWLPLSVTLSTRGFDDRQVLGIFRRPIELAFSVPIGTTIQIADVHLTGANGENLVANGDFSKGLRRWLFHDDSHRAWRIQDQYLDVLFEQGWFGLISFALLLATAIVYSARAAIAGNPTGAIAAASLTAFAIAGIPDYLTEAPRLAMIFYLICFASIVAPGNFSRPQTLRAP